ncbi:hypothetical protein PO909_006821 [Leuciscus waleckii]
MPISAKDSPGRLMFCGVNLRLILVSGKTQDFTFSPNDSATDIARHVFENWPAGWEEESVSSPGILRLIFQGRFLHGNVTLGGQKLFVLGKDAKLFADIQNATSLLNSSEVAPWPNNCHALGCQRDAARAELPWTRTQQ